MKSSREWTGKRRQGAITGPWALQNLEVRERRKTHKGDWEGVSSEDGGGEVEISSTRETVFQEWGRGGSALWSIADAVNNMGTWTWPFDILSQLESMPTLATALPYFLTPLSSLAGPQTHLSQSQPFSCSEPPPPPRRISMLCHLTSWASLLLRETWSTTACLLPSPGTLMLQIHYLCAVCLPLKGQRLHLFCLLRGLSPMPRTVPGLTSPACKTLGLQLRSVSHLILQSLYRKNIIYINSNYRYFFFQFYWDIVDTLHRISVRCTT